MNLFHRIRERVQARKAEQKAQACYDENMKNKFYILNDVGFRYYFPEVRTDAEYEAACLKKARWWSGLPNFQPKRDKQ